MAAPIKGYDGTVTIGGIVTAFVSNWKVQLETEESSSGPFIGDNGVLYTFTTSRTLTGSLEASVPTGKDAGQTTLISGALNSSYLSFDLVSVGGYTVSIPSGVITGFSLGQDAGEGVTLSVDFKSSGAFNIT